MQDRQIDLMFADLLVDQLGCELPGDEAGGSLVMAFAEAIAAPDEDDLMSGETAIVFPSTH